MAKLKEKFEVGDTVYLIDSMNSVYDKNCIWKYSVVRTTKTQAILNNDIKLKITNTDGGTAIGSNIWTTKYYYLETPELKSRWLKQNMRSRVSTKIDDVSKIKDNLDVIPLTELFNKLDELIKDFSKK
jgi:hypothetical protein